jgi:hypothetical protein
MAPIPAEKLPVALLDDYRPSIILQRKEKAQGFVTYL